MRTHLLFVLLITCTGLTIAQNNGIPSWFLEEIKTQEGIWVADNSAYKSADEPIDAYAIAWKRNPLRNSISGRLYGIQDSMEVGTYWDFLKYWDPAQQQVVLMQIGWNGTLGIGPITYITREKTEIIQVFTDPSGKARQDGHRSELTDPQTEVGSSYTINDQGEWIIQRTYTWKKIGPDKNNR